MSENIIYFLGILGAIVFATNVIVEVLKRLLPDKLPTDIVVFIVSIGLCEGALIAYNSYAVRGGQWYEYLLAILAGFMVAYIAMFGWEKISELWNRSKKPE